EYMHRYQNMWLILYNFEIDTVKNDRYRNNGIASTRAPDADKIKDLINGSVAAENKTRIIENCFIDKLAVYDAFIGKASPENIVNVLWMAHRYGFIANPKKPKAPGGYKPLLKAQ